MNFNRFINVARYNFAINRAQYMKLALSLFLVMALPFLMFVVKSIWFFAISGSAQLAVSTIPGTSMGTWMSMCFIFAMPIICGYTFHNLLTKQSRIKELTLPASNGEKFLFHALVTVGGAFLVYVISFLLIDLIQYLYVGLLYGFSYSEWVSYESIFLNVSNHGDVSLNSIVNPDTLGWLKAIRSFGWVAFFSTFVLGNAIKYRHNVLWTYVFHWVLSFVGVLGMGLLIPVFKDMDWSWIQDFDPEKAGTYLKVGSILFFSLVTIVCWWMSYRLYCRAQITTKRNK